MAVVAEVKTGKRRLIEYVMSPLLRKVDESNPLHKNLAIIEKETKRCKSIIANLLKFSRQDKVALGRTDINQVVRMLWLLWTINSAFTRCG